MPSFSRFPVLLPLAAVTLMAALTVGATTEPARLAATPEPAIDYRLPLTMRGAFAVVEAWLPGIERPLHLVVDSAAGGGVIDTELARSAGILKDDASSGMQVHGANGQTAALPMAQVAGLRIGEMKLAGQFITTDAKAFASEPEVSVDGILGNNVTAMFDATFDVNQGELLLRANAVDKGRCYLNSYPGRSKDLRRFAFIDVSLPGGAKVRAVIDTGAAQTVMNLAAAKVLGLQPGDARLQRRERGTQGMGPGKATDTWLYDLPDLEIGEWRLGPMKVRISELPIFARLSPDGRPTMILGIDALRQRRVTIERGAAAFCIGEG
ncbi:aspartyl protease family protein [Lysobacter sp. CA196]|uniref:aspartyl protease family protein n=1 Tax=Lysobacter sp. CA196 TaxID=3455606 RepID=UPI003F8D6A4C